MCDDLVAALINSQRHHQIQVEMEVVDIDLHPELEALYGDNVPVLLDGKSEICHHFFDEGAFLAHCTARSPASLLRLHDERLGVE